MELAAIFFLLVVLVSITIIVARPFFSQRRVHVLEEGDDLSRLQAEHERLLTALQELEFDHTLGKIPTEDYPNLRAELLHKGAEVLRQLDTLSSGNQGRAKKKEKKYSNAPAGRASLSDDDVETLIARRRTSRKGQSAGFCPNCGKPVLKSDLFCSFCGTSIN